MLISYIKIALRNYRKQPIAAIINILSLTLGLASGVFAILYALDEFSFDSFHKNGPHLYRVVSEIRDYNTDEIIGNIETNGWPVGAYLASFPEVQSVVYARSASFLTIEINGRKYNENLHFAGPEFFSMFTFPFSEGDPSSCLVDPYTVVITQSMAQKYFHDEEAMGRTIVMNDSLEFVVTGVVSDIPSNSHIQFDMLLSFASYERINTDFNYENGWGNYNVRNYILLDPNTDVYAFKDKAASLYMDAVGDWMKELGWKSFVRLEPLEDIYLNTAFGNGFGPVGSRQRVWMVVTIAFFVILLACVNFINLSTARSLDRARESGLRKVIGGTRGGLMRQFLVESFVTTVLAFGGALVLVFELLPIFNQMLDKSYHAANIFSYQMLGVILALVFLVSFIAGFYPSVVLSGYQPVDVLKGKMMTSQRGVQLRKGLVIFQFVISASLIIATLAVRHQMTFMNNQDLGFNKNQVVVMNARAVPQPVINAQAAAVMNDLSMQSGIQMASFSSALPGVPAWRGQVCHPEGMPEGQSVTVEYDPVDDHYIELLGFQLLAGRNFNKDIQSDLEEGLILNETSVRQMGYASPEEAIGKKIDSPSGHPAGTVIGVIKDYHHLGLQNKIGPLVLDYYLPSNRMFAIRYDAEETSAVLQQLEQIWKNRLEGYEFQYFFLDESFGKQYQKEMELANVFTLFSGITIFIAFTGFFGLTTFMIVSRQKEFGVRKVLGAGSATIAWMLSREYLALIVVANVIAIPITWWGISKWLEKFAYSEGMSTSIFVVAFLGLMVFTLLAISIQTIRAATAQPASVLRNE